ncbi:MULTISPECIES: methylenetetrahydrofolate reductase [Kushneria]|uniref:methylenetetrahydrofolate reductase n=1 Tax=Kushneria TaxID=504090 RepID=UPI001B8838B8|nr:MULTISPECIES: methylenetetrahydrofolate reductase [Kushneria]
MLRKALQEQHFVCVVEFVPKCSGEGFIAFEQLMQCSRLCDWPMMAAVADRVGSNADLSPITAFSQLRRPFPTLLHFSGKDRERHHLLAQLERMDAMGLDQLLILSSDRVPGHKPGQNTVRYLESVAALQIVRQARPT